MPLRKSIIDHPKYGKIEITINPRACRIIMRARPDAICITLPQAATTADLEHALATHGDTLLNRQIQSARPTIASGFKIETPNFVLQIEETHGTRFHIKEDNEGAFRLFCPAGSNLQTDTQQEWIRKVIINTMRKRAKDILPRRLQQLAKQHEFRYTSVSVRNSHSRWGSCSSRGSINLSIYLVLLDDKLIDYVLLHELCHTREMNHSQRFWNLLDSVCRCNSKELRNRLRTFKSPI